MRVITNVFKYLILLAFMGGMVFYAREYVPYFQPGPCKEPIPYNLGSFASEFKVSEEYFLEALKEAEAIWEKPHGGELFTYDPEDTSPSVLKINLVYDYRQEASSKLADLGIVAKDSQASYDSLKGKLDALKASYDAQKNAFNSRVAAFNSHESAYEKKVDYWNKKGGAPEEEYLALEKERAALQAESRSLESTQNKLNKMVGDINAMVVIVNRMARSLNLTVEKYNTINETRGESFEEGVYQSEGIKREINIYEFSDREKLVRVLAHELGHALGIDHVPDEKAIMYEYNLENSLTLTDADLSALALVCGK